MACCPTSPDRAELVDDLFLCREPPLVTLREDHLIPDADVEDPSAAADDLWLDVEFLPDLDRQTGGSGEVVSDAAIFNRDLQRPSSVPIVLLANCQPTRGDSVPPSKAAERRYLRSPTRKALGQEPILNSAKPRSGDIPSRGNVSVHRHPERARTRRMSPLRGSLRVDRRQPQRSRVGLRRCRRAAAERPR
jgi:hypothetical protein